MKPTQKPNECDGKVEVKIVREPFNWDKALEESAKRVKEILEKENETNTTTQPNT